MANIVILGLSITSSWGNGHATTFRALVKGLHALGHEVLFLECDKPWYAQNRDCPQPLGCRTVLYKDLNDLRQRFGRQVRSADVVMVGSYVPDGVTIGDWVLHHARGITTFYDIDTPVTLAALAKGTCEYISHQQVRDYDCYLSFSGGPVLEHIQNHFGSPMAKALYCSVDPKRHYPLDLPYRWSLGYLGTYSPDRQPRVDQLLLQTAEALHTSAFVVAGPNYPENIRWPRNVERIDHLAPHEHISFYASQAYTLNITRDDMRAAGWSPSVRLFEAAACGVPVISDRWPGIEDFFTDGESIILADTTDDVVHVLKDIDEGQRLAIGHAARERILARHTALHRAEDLEAILAEIPMHASPG